MLYSPLASAAKDTGPPFLAYILAWDAEVHTALGG